MKKCCFVWKKSVYENGFNCPKCGKRLFDPKTGEVSDNVGVDKDSVINHEERQALLLWCMECKEIVAYYYVGDFPEELCGLQGNYELYKADKRLREIMKTLEKKQ